MEIGTICAMKRCLYYVCLVNWLIFDSLQGFDLGNQRARSSQADRHFSLETNPLIGYAMLVQLRCIMSMTHQNLQQSTTPATFCTLSSFVMLAHCICVVGPVSALVLLCTDAYLYVFIEHEWHITWPPCKPPPATYDQGDEMQF